MATKFGLILVPSLLWLAWQRRLRGILLLALTIFVFFAVQGFKFDSESTRMIWWSIQNNAGGFEHQKWQNIITYLGVAIRALGIPVFIFAIVGLTRTRWREVLSRIVDMRLPASSAPARELTRHVRIIAVLPFALHALGLLAINTSFPRHALPLIPLALIAAAHGVEKNPRFRVIAALCLVWSGLLAWSDGRVFRDDPRERAWRELQRTHLGYPAGPMRGDAHVAVILENNIWRFERSELNPFRAPNELEMYNSSKEKLAAYQQFKQALAHGELKQVFQAGPLHILPEQFLYAAAWGSFEKFAGQCTLYERSASR
jgi:hypothetical protein